MSEDLRDAALEYHRSPPPGKLGIVATKPLANQRDLALAYSPGVAAACELIGKHPMEAASVTCRGNLIGVISNGTAVLGLGSIGPLAAKPVMEGKAVLFKKFSGLDVFDIEVAETDPERFVEVVASLEPTFGGINLEDIKAPECFEIEEKLRARMRIPVFHDDQHGTAIIVCAAVINGLHVVGKSIEQVKLVTSGAGAAALACVDLLVSVGLPVENVWITDLAGVVYNGRTELMDRWKQRYGKDTPARTLADVIEDADIFLGLSAPNVVKPDMIKRMADRPLVFALANPVPEIMPEQVKAVRQDALIATGRSDYPNQVNNVLCFPYIFRGALDVGATGINEAMKIACANGLASLARAEPSDVVAMAYGGEELKFGPDYLIPKPFDPRLIVELAPAVAKAAMDSGIASRPISDFAAYRQRLSEFVFRSGTLMKPVFAAAKRRPMRLVYAEGETRRVLRAVQVVVDEGVAEPILIGRREVIADRIHELGLRLEPDRHFALLDPNDNPRYPVHWRAYHRLMERRGITPEAAQRLVRTRTTALAALMVRLGEADAGLCGPLGDYRMHLRHVLDIVGKREGVHDLSAIRALILPKGTYFVCDTHVTLDPTAQEITEMALLAADAVRRFGMQPKVALLSHSNFGSIDCPSAQKMREARAMLETMAPELECEGEMRADTALSAEIRDRIFPNSRLQGEANLLIMPTVEAANIAYNMVKMLGQAVAIGPILIGVARPIHIMTESVTVRGLVNMSALAVVDAQGQDRGSRERAEGV
ncbi:MAG: NADP-dependent malic enzyme [Gammaproteobacteria bacterium]|jgi:malate dehydrogenase (oxaloacetate-decarboxylating)(NADP+)